MSDFLLNKSFSEHHKYPNGEDVPEDIASQLSEIVFNGLEDKKCVFFSYHAKTDIPQNIHTNYFIGTDWIDKQHQLAIFVEPKLNKEEFQTDYLTMLMDCLRHPEISNYLKDLYEIKFDTPTIELNQNRDLLTPLLVIHFLNIVKEIVRKGLKKSFYFTEQNINSRIKGKILISKTIKLDHFRCKPTYSFCRYQDFGYDNLENRLLKKALTFVQKYLPVLFKNVNQRPGKKDTFNYFIETFNYILPAFQMVNDDIDYNETKVFKSNIFYKEYEEGLRLAKMILKRFGYNIKNIDQGGLITVPPFWIDMSKLFELYVLGLLKDRFGNKVEYHFKSPDNELDYLLDGDGYQMVIDAKYKTKYQDDIDINDIRQVSGYARLNDVYERFGKDPDRVIDCLIIYVDQQKGLIDLKEVDFLIEKNKIENYIHFYKVPVKLPFIQ